MTITTIENYQEVTKSYLEGVIVRKRKRRHGEMKTRIYVVTSDGVDYRIYRELTDRLQQHFETLGQEMIGQEVYFLPAQTRRRVNRYILDVQPKPPFQLALSI